MTRFTTQIASDLIRDGLGVEPLDPASEVIAEIFRSDANHTVTSTFLPTTFRFTRSNNSSNARAALHPFEDGTALSAAVDAAVPPSES